MEKSKYDIKVSGVDENDVPHTITVDWYSIVRNQKVSSPVEHCLKKGLHMGKRSGGKSYDRDLEDMIWSLQKEQALRYMDAR
jgi:hypothetical protein